MNVTHQISSAKDLLLAKRDKKKYYVDEMLGLTKGFCRTSEKFVIFGYSYAHKCLRARGGSEVYKKGEGELDGVKKHIRPKGTSIKFHKYI